jgi:hypothetical protein
MLAYQQSAGEECHNCVAGTDSSSKMCWRKVEAAILCAGRLMGFLPNDREVEVGLASKS